MRTLLVALMLVATLSGCAAQADGGSTAELTPATVLDFTATTVDGAAFDGAQLAGRPTVLWFWAPWCPTCKRQAAGVADLATTYAGQVNVVGVGSLDDPAAIRDFASKVPADLPQLLDPKGAVWRHFGVTAQSTYVVLDEDHSVVSTGYLDDQDLVDLVAGLTR